MKRARTLLIAYADDSFVEILRDEICSARDIAVFHATRQRTALALLRRYQWDVFLIGLSLPHLQWPEIMVQIRSIEPQQRLVVVGKPPEEEHALQALELGIEGYVTDGTAPQEVVLALHHVLSGRKYFSASLSPLLTQKQRLSQRQQELILTSTS